MKRSRRQNPFTIFLNRILKLVLLVLFCVATAGSGVVYIRNQIANTARHVKSLERKIVVEERRYARLGAELSEAMATERLVEKIDLLALDLDVPDDRKIVRVSIDPDQRLLSKGSKELLTSNSF